MKLLDRLTAVHATIDLAYAAIEDPSCAKDEEQGRWALRLASRELYSVLEDIKRETKRIEAEEM